MNQAFAIPTGPAAVTADWMTGVLRGAGIIRTSNVTSIRAEPVSSQGIIGQLARFHLSYDGGEETQVPSVVGKFSAGLPDDRKNLLNLYRNEFAFYQKRLTDPGIPVPGLYHAAIDESTGEHILLMEDLSASARPGCLVCGCTLEEARAAVAHLAKFHAAWWENKHQEQFADLSHKRDYLDSYAKDQFAAELEELLQRVRQDMPGVDLSASFLESARLLARNFHRVKTVLYGAPVTVVHDDYHLDNILFRGGRENPEPVVIDWQLVCRGAGVSDLGYFIAFSLSPEQRRQAGDELVNTYYTTLCENGVSGYDYSRFLLGFRLSAVEPLERLVQVRYALDRSNSRVLAIFQSVLYRLSAFSEDCRIGELLS